MTTKTVADAMADALIEAGVEIVFGLPGGEVVAVLDGLRRNNIRFVLAHNESDALFMADVYARLSGKPGVVLTTLGPGAANAVAGASHAHLDRAPVLIITAQMPTHLHSHHTHQLIDLHALYAPITKASLPLEGTGAAATLRAALQLTQQGRPGPVHLTIDKETAEQPALDGAAPASLQPPAMTPPPHPTDSEQFTLARNRLAAAERPVILAGLGLESERPYEALRALAEAAQAPVITTPKGKGALPDDHSLAAGTLGLTRTDPVYEVLDEADCIIALGFDVVELVKPWDQPAPLIWLAPWPNHDPAIPAEAEFVGPMAPVLQQLADLPLTSNPNWGATRVAAFRDKLAQNVPSDPAPGRMRPQAVFRAVREHLPAESAVAVDVGSHKILGSLTWPALTPNRFFLSNGLSCMGFALPAMIAAAMAAPDQPAVCFTGDAGLAMVSGELALLAQYQLPVIVVVFHDAAIDLIRSHQVRAGYPVFGTEFFAPDFTQIAQAYGLPARRVTTETECAAAVQEGVATRRPMLIEAMIDPTGYPTTPATAAATP